MSHVVRGFNTHSGRRVRKQDGVRARISPRLDNLPRDLSMIVDISAAAAVACTAYGILRCESVRYGSTEHHA